MRIIGLIKKDSGVDFHRIMMPLLMMDGPDCYITNSLKEEDLEKGCDAIYYSRIISEEIINQRSKYGFKVILDIDDYWRLDYHHIAYKGYMDNDFEALQIRHLHMADLVTTTHERLAEKIYTYNKNVILCPNAIPNHEYFKIDRQESERVRLFWQGSITHEKDIELLKNPFRRLNKSKTLNVIAGYTKHDAWDRMVSSYTNGLNLPGVVLPSSSPMEYYKNYAYADICLAPLISSEFNSFKSNLKILEAAHAELPVIASRVHPYLKMPVLYAEKQTDWFKHINNLVNNPQLRKDIGQNLKSYCNTHFNFNKINQYRLEEIKKVINKKEAA